MTSDKAKAVVILAGAGILVYVAWEVYKGIGNAIGDIEAVPGQMWNWFKGVLPTFPAATGPGGTGGPDQATPSLSVGSSSNGIYSDTGPDTDAAASDQAMGSIMSGG